MPLYLYRYVIILTCLYGARIRILPTRESHQTSIFRVIVGIDYSLYIVMVWIISQTLKFDPKVYCLSRA